MFNRWSQRRLEHAADHAIVRRPWRLLVFAFVALLWSAPHPSVTLAAADPIILAAGDIASCASPGDETTANLLDALTGTVITLGDNAYESGTAAEYANCYQPSWGRHKSVTKPSPGNHEYNTPGASGYYGYFGGVAGNPAQGWYSYDLGSWHIISLNSNCSFIGGCTAGSPQETWLRQDLAAHGAACTLAYWHHPLFTSGVRGNAVSMQPVWQALFDYGADLVLNGHDHDYERFMPQTPAGVADAAFGIREIVVGTGGKSHYALAVGGTNSEVHNDDTYGVLQLTLRATGYDWQFIPEPGKTFADAGSFACHGPTLPDTDGDNWVDASDNCASIANPGQQNADGNFISQHPAYVIDDLTRANSDAQGDACDPDDDNDGIPDVAEAAGPPCPTATSPTDPLTSDSDGDRVTDYAECAMGSDPVDPFSKPAIPAAALDPDVDRLPTSLEVAIGSNPSIPDSDADGLPDGVEFKGYGTSPIAIDTDGDGTRDGCEAASLNTDTVVNSGDQTMLAVELQRAPPPPRLANMDINRDGVLNAGDQVYVAVRIGPGKCP